MSVAKPNHQTTKPFYCRGLICRTTNRSKAALDVGKRAVTRDDRLGIKRLEAGDQQPLAIEALGGGERLLVDIKAQALGVETRMDDAAAKALLEQRLVKALIGASIRGGPTAQRLAGLLRIEPFGKALAERGDFCRRRCRAAVCSSARPQSCAARASVRNTSPAVR